MGLGRKRSLTRPKWLAPSQAARRTRRLKAAVAGRGEISKPPPRKGMAIRGIGVGAGMSVIDPLTLGGEGFRLDQLPEPVLELGDGTRGTALPARGARDLDRHDLAHPAGPAREERDA